MAEIKVRGCDCIDWPCCGHEEVAYTGADAQRAYERDRVLGLTHEDRGFDEDPDKYWNQMKRAFLKECKESGCEYGETDSCDQCEGYGGPKSFEQMLDEGCDALSVFIEETEEAQMMDAENRMDMYG